VNGAIRLERRDEGLKEIQKLYPQFAQTTPDHTEQLNRHQGRDNWKDEEIVIGCEVGWKLFEYFKQDFICLAFRILRERGSATWCLKKECKSPPSQPTETAE